MQQPAKVNRCRRRLQSHQSPPEQPGHLHATAQVNQATSETRRTNRAPIELSLAFGSERVATMIRRPTRSGWLNLTAAETSASMSARTCASEQMLLVRRGRSTSRSSRRCLVGNHRNPARHDPPMGTSTLRTTLESLTRSRNYAVVSQR